jgi:serpin B
MKIAILVCVGVLGLCHGEGVAYSSTAEVENFNYYTFDAYRKVFDGNKNFVFSPLSLRVIYNILFQSATGDAEKSLKSLLFHETSIDVKQNVIDGQRENLNSIWNSPNVKLANKLYMREGSELTDNFNEIVTKYKSEYDYVDFSKGAEIAAIMNQWVENKTNGLIQNLVDSNSIDESDQLYAINTLYFKADWETPYDKYNVKTEAFHSADGTNSDIVFINHKNSYSIARLDDLKVDVLEIPYESQSGFVFWIILPRAESNLVKLSGQLNSVFFERVGKTLNQTYAFVKFPVFTIESEVDGKSVSPESFANADFEVLKNSGGLKVDEIKQKAKIIVNTMGTEASAATYSKIVLLSAYIEPEATTFIADRPFVFAVVAKTSNQPIFVGHYAQA